MPRKHFKQNSSFDVLKLIHRAGLLFKIRFWRRLGTSKNHAWFRHMRVITYFFHVSAEIWNGFGR